MNFAGFSSFQYRSKFNHSFLRRNFANFRIGQPHPQTHPHLMKENEITPGVTFEEYRRRRKDFWNLLCLIADMKKVKKERMVALIPSSPELFMSFDIPYTFRQDTNMNYLTGYQEPESLLVMENDKNTMFVRERDPSKELWNGPRSGTKGVMNVFGIDKAFPLSNLQQNIRSILTDSSLVFYERNINPEITKMIESTINVPFISPTQVLSTLRLKKSPAEIQLMRQSCEIAAKSMIEVMKITKPGISEHLLGSKMEYECKIRGAQRLSYPCVVAGGVNANTLHYITNDMILRNGDLVLMDAGCEYNGYSSDITRTFPINGRYTKEQREIYNIVLNANKKCIKMCKPGKGISIRKIHQLSVQLMEEDLINIGLVNKHVSLSKLFPHSIGHWLGMDVHDVNDISTSESIEDGMILTIEPGLYIPDEPEIPEKYRGIGIRIEDDILVTKDEPEVLTRFVPKEPEEIEKIMNS